MLSHEVIQVEQFPLIKKLLVLETAGRGCQAKTLPYSEQILTFAQTV